MLILIYNLPGWVTFSLLERVAFEIFSGNFEHQKAVILAAPSVEDD